MAERPALRALAERLGILPGFEEAGSRTWRETPDATREALLGALGYAADTEAGARRCLAALDAEAAAAPRAPTHVTREGDPAPWRLRLAAASGALRYELAIRDESGRTRERRGRLRAARGRARLRLPRLAPGCYELTARLRSASAERELRATWIVAPRRCAEPGARRVFGLWTNLYTLRSDRQLGVGNLSDLGQLVRFAGRAGAAFVGLNPLHATRNRDHEVGPYSPSSRLFRNPIYLDVRAVPEFAASRDAQSLLGEPGVRRELEALRRAERIDYERVSELQAPLLAALHRAHRAARRAGPTPRARAFERYRRREGELLQSFATFAALEEHLAAQGHPRDWRAWPAPYREPGSREVREFAERHAEAVECQAFVQFELDRQLGAAAAAARRAGLGIGLYQDLALGSVAGGFDTWAFQRLFVQGVSLGAPPDAYAARGQDWGLPPLDPRALDRSGFDYFRRLLRVAFGHAGALRIDHAMGLVRQWWIPAGRPPAEGAYLRFPARELLGVLALESRRHGALVIGEDLGTVPRGFAALLASRGVLSSRVMYFERDRRGGFRPASAYSRRALVTANTHDLPTLAGFWEGSDLERRHAAGVIADADALARARAEREDERRALLARLRRDGLLGREAEPEPAELVRAVHAFLCRTPAPLVGVSLDDLAGEREAVNLPGVSADRHPSWTRRMRLGVEALPGDPGVRRALQGLAERVP